MKSAHDRGATAAIRYRQGLPPSYTRTIAYRDPFPVASMGACALTIPGTHNSRDLGDRGRGRSDATRGDPTFRRSGPARRRGRSALEAVGVRTAIDLREPVERALDPVDVSDSGISLVEWPLIDGRVDLTTPMGWRRCMARS